MLLASCAASTAAAKAVAASSSSRPSALRHVVFAEGSSTQGFCPCCANRRLRSSATATTMAAVRPRLPHPRGRNGIRVVMTRARTSDEDGPEQSINDMMKEDLGVDVEAIKSMIDSDPVVREQERLMATEARNAASLQVDAQMAEEESMIAKEYGSKGTEAGAALQVGKTRCNATKTLRRRRKTARAGRDGITHRVQQSGFSFFPSPR